MVCAAVICEFNPFHNGHRIILEYAKTCADYVIVLMSGDYVQRGEPALTDRHSRAKMALAGGADLVLSLPSRFAASSAESFSEHAVRILNRLNVVDYLVFGSESGSLPELAACARHLISEDDQFKKQLKEGLKKGFSFPKARGIALPEWSGLLSGPNNILALEYLKALMRTDSKIRPLTCLRRGSMHDSGELSAIPSAAALRRALSGGREVSELSSGVPSPVLDLLKECAASDGFIFPDDFSVVLAAALRNAEDAGALCVYEDVTESLANTFIHMRPDYVSMNRFADLCVSKAFTRTRVMRALLHIALGIRKDDPAAQGLITQVLGFRKEASGLVGLIRKKAELPVVVNPPKDIWMLEKSDYSLFAEELRLSDLYRMIRAVKCGVPGGCEIAEAVVKV